ncbi:AAA family ATPase [Amnibacterium setariae]|uniref:Nuclease SbcCD subunit C n=1 Tax=Amnibacterium setariae TaxID=2306585 RepID=A0A3A1U7W5_9MICO|nr:AAA family ATPase [Amnibacterium setariae]RIX31138.1 SMC family ATPase [Amnibacterium setariae]
MRIRRLVVEGFGPFAGRQEIDFAPLDEAGLFLITGRTGSGKSSILDAICFALYGTAPRYDGAQARLRSDHAGVGDPTRVELELVVAGERWRVVRSPEYERLKQRGTGTTREPQAATLERWEQGGWTGVAARPVDVAEHLGPVLQLTREQFLQVILLAQGRFQEFLKAKSEDRLDLLRALFGTERFQLFEREIAERARALEQSVGASAAAIRADLGRIADLVGDGLPDDADGPWAGQVLARLRERVVAAEEDAATSGASFAAADAALASATAVADRQRRRESARAELATIESQRAAVEQTRRRVAEAVRVLPVLPSVETAARAVAERAAAERQVAATRAALPSDVEDPGAAGAELDGLLGSLADRLAEERALPRLRAGAADAERGEQDAERRLAELAAESAGLPARRVELQERRLRAEAAADGLPAAEAALVRARRIADAVAAADRAAATRRTAEEALDRALATEQEAIARTRALLRARLDGAAGLLAGALRPDEPCPVCGSLEHPAPASTDAGTPDDAVIAAAEQDQQRAAERRAAAQAAADDARTALATAAAAAEGATAEGAADGVRAASSAVDGARAAAAAREDATRRLGDLEAREQALASAVERARAVLAERTAATAAARSSLEAAVARVASAREDAPTVADRVAALRRRRAALAAAEEAARRRAAAVAAERDAEERLADALVAAGLPDAGSARSAALPREEREALERRIRAWETARDGATAQLAEPDVAGAPEEPADVAGAAAAKREALAARDAAADRLAAARQTIAAAEQLAARVASVEAATAADREQLAVVGPLAEVVRGGGSNAFRMRLESYVLAARLEQIVAAANVRLAAMTDGRFTLQHDDGPAYRGARSGLGLAVLDEHTGRPRPVASLSGGETFLASLALALGLAEVVSAEAGGVRLDTLFVDEGFGSLDRRTLDTAMETLDSLRAGGRTVGLISHVEAMQEDIPAGLHVERLPDGSSAVRSRVPSPA